MVKHLPFKYPPIVDVYSGYASIVAIAQNYDQWIPWIASRFIRIAFHQRYNFLDFFDRKYEDFYRNYRDNPFLTEIDITNDLAKGNSSDYIIDSINNGNYIFICLDHFNIEGSEAFNKQHIVHDRTLISGYDLDRKMFYLADNFNTSGKYTIISEPFRNVENAIKSTRDLKNSTTVRQNFKSDLRLVFNHDVSYQFDLEEIKIAFGDYLDGTDQSAGDGKVEYSNKDIIYGIDCYQYIHDYLKSLQQNKVSYDHRALHLMCNHKTIILLLINLLTEQGKLNNGEDLYGAFKEIEKNCIAARDLFIKFLVTEDKEIINRIVDIYGWIRSNEVKNINRLLENISTGRES